MITKPFSFKIQKVIPALVIAAFLPLSSCNTSSEANNMSSTESLPEEKNRVEITILAEQDFTREIVSNGKLTAIQRAELYFEIAGIIEAILVKNGQKITKGREIGKLQNKDYQFALRKAELRKEQVEIDKLDALIGMGYKQGSKNITPEHEKIANIRSGYHEAEIQYEEARNNLERTTLHAPFSGTITGIVQHQYEKADFSKPFCTLVNDSRFYIDFPLLETEINEVKVGQKLGITPIAGAQACTGKISEIDPRIDENGLVWLKAEVKNPGEYMEGMNVKVSIKRAVQGQLVVPKQAVVLRQNSEVLFRYTNGISYWTYINILDENENQYAVIAADGATLELGDTVIISNNLNLAHESEVEIN